MLTTTNASGVTVPRVLSLPRTKQESEEDGQADEGEKCQEGYGLLWY